MRSISSSGAPTGMFSGERGGDTPASACTRWNGDTRSDIARRAGLACPSPTRPSWNSGSPIRMPDTVFAMTVHQSQGSEFEKVLLIVPNTASPILTRELIYTGMTRARQRLCVWAPTPSLLLQACEQQVQRSGGLL